MLVGRGLGRLWPAFNHCICDPAQSQQAYLVVTIEAKRQVVGCISGRAFLTVLTSYYS